MSSLGYEAEAVDIMKLPLGTRFYAENGNWYGRIAGTPENKTVFVEATGETHQLRPDHGLEITVVDEDGDPE